jgi:biopolymer transport protein ExbD
MVTTTMRETTIYVRVHPPKATEVEKLEKKSMVSSIYVGPPMVLKYGLEPRIQLNDQFATLKDIPEFIEQERNARDEVDRKFLITSLKVDKTVKMGVISDIKQELRNVGAFKINYSSMRKTETK